MANTILMRSSSYSKYDFCQQSYLLSYVLGLSEGTNKRTELGSMLHKFMEILALYKKAKQDGLPTFVDHEIFGEKPLSFIEDGDIMAITEEVFAYYTKASKHDWTVKELKELKGWVNKVLTKNKGCYDPRNLDIFQAEQNFEFEIHKEWAKYDLQIWNTETQSYDNQKGYLKIRGTIDLLVKEDEDTLAIWDYKTGKRKDWGTGKEKDYEYLLNDFQLLLYHYAAQKLFPGFKHYMVNIFFINDGGVFSLPYDKGDLTKTEHMIKTRFKEILDMRVPHLNRGWHCKKFCYFGKNSHPASVRSHTICEHIHKETLKHGLEYVEKKYTEPGFTVGYYKAPGTV